MVLVDKNSFLVNISMAEPIFYSPCVRLIMLTNDYEEWSMESCNLTSQDFEWKA